MTQEHLRQGTTNAAPDIQHCILHKDVVAKPAPV